MAALHVHRLCYAMFHWPGRLLASATVSALCRSVSSAVFTSLSLHDVHLQATSFIVESVDLSF